MLKKQVWNFPIWMRRYLIQLPIMQILEGWCQIARVLVLLARKRKGLASDLPVETWNIYLYWKEMRAIFIQFLLGLTNHRALIVKIYSNWMESRLPTCTSFLSIYWGELITLFRLSHWRRSCGGVHSLFCKFFKNSNNLRRPLFDLWILIILRIPIIKVLVFWHFYIFLKKFFGLGPFVRFGPSWFDESFDLGFSPIL